MKMFIYACLLISHLCFAGTNTDNKLTVILDWYANPDHAPLFVAQEQGFFEQEGVTVELIGPSDPTDPPKWVAAGKADIAITYQPQFLEQIDRGLPLLMIGNLIDQPLNALVVRADAGIQSLADLKHKKIGYSGSGINSSMLRVALAKQHVNLTDVEIITTHYDLTQALLSGQVDAVTGVMRNFELIQMALAGHPGKAFYPEENGMPTYGELIYVIHKNHRNDQRITHFLTAVQRGVRYLQLHPDAAWEAFAQAHPEANDALNHRAYMATLPYFANNPGGLDRKKLLKLAKFMQTNGLITRIQPISNYMLLKE